MNLNCITTALLGPFCAWVQDGEVTESEYLGSILVMLDAVDGPTVELIQTHFKLLDINHDKVLDIDDIKLMQKQNFTADVFSKQAKQAPIQGQCTCATRPLCGGAKRMGERGEGRGRGADARVSEWAAWA